MNSNLSLYSYKVLLLEVLRTGLSFYQVRQSLSVVSQEELIQEDIVLYVISTGIAQKDMDTVNRHFLDTVNDIF